MSSHKDDFRDVAAERAVLAGICTYGGDAFVDVADLIDATAFTENRYAALYKCFEHIYHETLDRKIDLPTILSTAKSLNLEEYVSGPENFRHMRAVFNYPIAKETVKYEAQKLFKLSWTKGADEIVAQIRRDLRTVKGDEAINRIISLLENPIFNYTAKVNKAGDDGPTHIAHGIDEFLTSLEENPRDNIGISTGFGKYDWCIGGGLRRSTVNIVAARPKTGKTMWLDNVALHIAGNLNIPIINLDTEMTREEHLARILANLCQSREGVTVSVREIETGKYVHDGEKRKAVRKAGEYLKTIPYEYDSVIDKSFEEQIAIIRRWVVKRVGVDNKGRTNDCVVLYDYLQLMDPGEFGGDFKEYQILGFQMLALLRMAARCDIPILSLLQVNRDGIEKEHTGIAAGSDRIVWKAANFTLLKRKTIDEIAEDGEDEGKLKLIPLVARHGEELEQGDYINIKFDGATARMVEGKTRNEIYRDKKRSIPEGVEIQDEFSDDEVHTF